MACGRWAGGLGTFSVFFFAFFLVHFLFSANNNSSIHVLSIASRFRHDFFLNVQNTYRYLVLPCTVGVELG